VWSVLNKILKLLFVVTTDPDVISPSEISVLDALLNGARALSLKVTRLLLCHEWLFSTEFFLFLNALFDVNSVNSITRLYYEISKPLLISG